MIVGAFLRTDQERRLSSDYFLENSDSGPPASVHYVGNEVRPRQSSEPAPGVVASQPLYNGDISS